MTEQHKRNISNALKGKMPKHIPDNRGRKFSDEHKEKLRLAKLGKKRKPHSKETIEKMREAKRGKVGYWRGKKRPNLSGEKNWQWKGGKERKAWWARVRRAKKFNNGGSHTLEEWELLKAQYNWTCPCCKKNEPEIKLTLDHIIAISKGGSDNIENIQPLCGRCNSSKQTKEIKYDY